jgi:hypothetical protein
MALEDDRTGRSDAVARAGVCAPMCDAAARSFCWPGSTKLRNSAPLGFRRKHFRARGAGMETLVSASRAAGARWFAWATSDPGEPTPAWAPGRGPARRLLGGGLDLTAEENQVYLFMVVFGAVLFGTPPLVKLWKMCGFGKNVAIQEIGVDQELWEFGEEFEDMKHVHDPLDGDAREGRKKKRRGIR